MLKKHYSTIINLYLPLALFLICFIFKFIFIEKRDISIDEPFSIFHAQQDLKHIFSLSTQGEPNTPLFLVLLHFWIKLFGYDATFLRILPLIFNCLTAVIIYQTGKRFFNLPSAITASLLFIFSFSQFFHGLEVRSYSMFTLAASLTLYCFLDVINSRSKGSIARLVLSNLFVVYSHYFGLFIIFSEGIALLFYLKDHKILKFVVLSTGMTILGFAPMIRIIINQFFLSSKGTWLSSPLSGDYRKWLLFLFNHESIFTAFQLILVIAAILFLFRFLKYRHWKPMLDKKYIILLLWSIIPFTLMYFISFKMPIFTGRYILYTAPGFYLLTASIISTLLSKYRIIELTALTVVLVLMAYHLRILPHDFGWRDIKKSADYISHSEKELTNRVIIVYPAWVDLEFIFHYNLQLFTSYDNFDTRCRDMRIRNAWSVAQIKEFVKEYKGNDLILLTNTGKEETQKAFAVVDSSHVIIKQAEFPEFYVAGIFKARK